MFKAIPNRYYKLLLILLGIDAIFVVFHLLHHVSIFEIWLPVFQNKIFCLTQDRGLAEIWQYVKELTLVATFGVLAWRGSWGYLSWAGLFGYFLVDDMWSIHEVVGNWLVSTLSLQAMFYVRAKDLGELIFFAIIGIAFLCLITLGYSKSQFKVKGNFKLLLILLLFLILFGIVFDTATIFIYKLTGSAILSNIFGLIEEGGELVVLSAFVWLGFNFLRKKVLN